ncbi:hypothetical protein AUJ27_03400 [Candidatus Falkowbacteria bacterium CG1_02_37_44]|uniref:Uncharacterized protein n=1 Tax=Candidatus Falkowbacteria bacterium CG1_02_37_44 TaxID=1805146 RepID=A0A1J4T499_9BACT|nr:MAG: hypothetical protein AUJ27_03400 [Candidatus Falkowbacteria bacterium CG1_02_37_44]
MTNKINKNIIPVFFQIIFFVSILLIFPNRSFGADLDTKWSQVESFSFGLNNPSSIYIYNSELYIYGQKADGNLRLEKRDLSSGALLWSKDGIMSTDLGYIAVNSNGIFLAGWEPNKIVYEKLDLAGNIIWKITKSIFSFSWAFGIEIDNNSFYTVIEGLDSSNGQYHDYIEKRRLDNGNIILEVNATAGSYYACYPVSCDRITLDPSGSYLFTGGKVIEKRRTSDLGLVWSKSFPEININVSADSNAVYTFGSEPTGFLDSRLVLRKIDINNGSVLWVKYIDYFPAYDYAGPITVDASGVYVTAAISDVSNFPSVKWLMEKRDLSNGALIKQRIDNFSNFDNGNAGYYERIFDIARHPTGLYIAGNYSLSANWAPQNSQWRIEKRENTSVCLGPFSFIWTDNPLVGGATSLNSVHFNELANAIDTLRADAALPAVSWSYVTNSVSDVQFNTLRAKLEEVYTACGQPIPVWTGGAVTNASPLKASQVTELRNAIANAR